MTTTSKDYADALFSLAVEEGTLDDVLSALRLVKDTLAGDKEAVDMLASPAIPKEERIAVIDATFDGCVHEHVMSFLKVLCSNGYIRCLNDCVEEFEELYRVAKNLSTAYVTSAVPLSEADCAALKAKLEKRLHRSITLVCDVDASLLGGLVVRVDGKVLDGSIRHRLDEIKEVMNT